MPNIGPLELGLVLIVALIILGPKKLPDMGRSLGKGMREFKGAISGESDDRRDDADESPAPALAQAKHDDAKHDDAEHEAAEPVDAEPVAAERRERTATAA